MIARVAMSLMIREASVVMKTTMVRLMPITLMTRGRS